MTRLEQLAQELIDLFLDSDTTKETYSVAVASVIKEAREDILRDIEKCLGRDLDKAIEQLTWLDEFHEEEEDLIEEWKDKEAEPGFVQVENYWRTWETTQDDLNDHSL